MRATIRDIILTSLGTLAKPQKGVHIINAHFLNSVTRSSNQDFLIEQLNYIKKYCELVNIQDAVDLIRNGQNVSAPLVSYTFDDGFQECYSSIAPIFDSFGISAGFFINPNFVDGDEEYYSKFSRRVTTYNKRAMTWSNIKELHLKGHIIGAHTMDHVNLGNSTLSHGELVYQLKNCREVIEEKVGNNCNMFAFPYGRLNNLSSEALKIARENYDVVLSGTDYKNYFSFEGKVINRRHIEPFWPLTHVKFFLSAKKKY